MKKPSMSGLYALTEWITKFAYVNILWIGFSLLGLVVLGVFPATVAMFSIIRKWLLGEDIPIFKTFWNTYKIEFLKSNGLGVVLVVLAGIVYLDLYFMKINANYLFSLAHIPLYLLILFIILTVLYLFPVYVHYNVRFIQMFKNAFLIMLINPFNNLFMLLGIVASFFVIKFLPGIVFFFGGSMIAGIIMANCYAAFKKIESKKGGYTTEDSHSSIH